MMPCKRKETIGNATLYLGDCMDVMAEMEPGSVDAVVTDPPYGMSFQSNYRAEQHGKIHGDGDSACLKWACLVPVKHSRYVFCRWDNLVDLPQPKSCVTWVKNNWSMGDLKHEHARQTELILFYPGERHFFPKYRPQDVIRSARTGNENHPSEKPIGVMQTVVSWTNGIVVDPFMGSGTTGVACADLGRKFIGIELEEKYFDIACRRIDLAQRQLKIC